MRAEAVKIEGWRLSM